MDWYRTLLRPDGANGPKVSQTALLNVDIIIRELVEMPMDRAIALVA